MLVKANDKSKSEGLAELPASGSAATTEDLDNYYGMPFLKRPKWRWEIALYFFFEGISAGTFLLGSLADLSGNQRLWAFPQTAYDLAFLTLAPCPPLLIADLGRPKRFHHMLRVFKPASPMNLGAWTLAGFSGALSAITAQRLIGNGSSENNKLMLRSALGAAGVPFALTMISYPGVLLSTTSTPVWSRSRFLGALLASSSISTAAAASSLVLSLRGGDHSHALDRLRQIETVSRTCEAGALTAYVVTLKDAARPLTKGRQAAWFWLGAIGCGLLLPAILSEGPNRKRRRSRKRSILRSALTLAGGFALKWAITHAGRQSADDVRASHSATRPNESAVGWRPN